ncbi:MAG: hypothetical protein U0169_25005 [Polyangiaceae bacterium]
MVRRLRGSLARTRSAFPSATWSAVAVALVTWAFGFAMVGCTPRIGDKCTLSTDCSVQGDRLCDTSAPEGYCTVFNCQGNGCPNDARCLLFNPQVPGCGYDDRAISRVGRTFCMAPCEKDTDCRKGYVCADARTAPWFAIALDDDTTKKVCIAAPRERASSEAPDTSAAVCQASGPAVPGIDASTTPMPDGALPPPDAATGDGGTDGAPLDAGTDGTVDVDAAPDGASPDAGVDATVGDSGSDAADASG